MFCVLSGKPVMKSLQAFCWKPLPNDYFYFKFEMNFKFLIRDNPKWQQRRFIFIFRNKLPYWT